MPELPKELTCQEEVQVVPQVQACPEPPELPSLAQQMKDGGFNCRTAKMGEFCRRDHEEAE